MEKTIKAENARKVFRQEYLNDNLSIESVIDSEDKQVTVVLRRIVENSIQETVLMKLPLEVYMESFEEPVRIDQNNSSIATFTKEGNEYRLNNIYDINENSMIPEDFKDLFFKQKFPELKFENNLVLTKKNNGGAVYWQA